MGDIVIIINTLDNELKVGSGVEINLVGKRMFRNRSIRKYYIHINLQTVEMDTLLTILNKEADQSKLPHAMGSNILWF